MVGFVSFEGGDGSGKTTQIRILESYLLKRGHSCMVTREPGGTSLGNLIRRVLLEVGDHDIAQTTELFLYLADRAQHVNEIIRPALAAGKIVLCDRFTDSTVAYQGYGRGIEIKTLQSLNEIADDGVRPQLTFLFDCPVAVGLARTSDRRNQPGQPREDRFEREKIEFHEQIRAGFLQMACAEPDRFRIVDASGNVDEVAAAVKNIADREILQ